MSMFAPLPSLAGAIQRNKRNQLQEAMMQTQLMGGIMQHKSLQDEMMARQQQQEQLNATISGLPADQQSLARLNPPAYAKARLDQMNQKPQVVSPGAALVDASGKPLFQAGFKPDVLSPEAEQQKLRIARASKPDPTSVNVRVNEGERAYTKKGSELAVQEDTEQFKRAQTAANNIGKLDDVINHLKTSDAITGFGAEMFKDLERMRAQFLRSKQANKNASDTELLDTMLGSDVFPMIQSLGIGARGMDTPAEREFLRQVMTGTVSMNKDTLLRMAEMRRKAAESEVGRWNKRTEAGELDRWYEAFGRQKQPLGLPNRPGGDGQGEVMDAMPKASQHKGKIIEDDQGRRFKSDGMTWKPL